MNILALDISTTSGFAQGEPGGRPKSWTVRLKRPSDPAETAAFNMLAFLRDHFVLQKPDLVVLEDYMHPSAHKSTDALTIALALHYVATSIATAYTVQWRKVHVDAVRKHFLGFARTGERKETKAAVLRRCRQLKYLDLTCSDDNRADACAVWDYACAHFARKPSDLVLFEGRR